MTQAYDNFGAYSAGAISSVASPTWSVQAAGSGDWTQNIAVDGAATGGKTAIITRTSTGASTNIVVYDSIAAQSGDVEVVGRYKFDMTAGALTAIGPNLVAADGQCYGLYAVDASNVRLARFTTALAVTTNIAVAIAFAVPDQGYIWARVGRSGTTIRASIWLDADPDPGFLTSGTNTALTDLKGGFVCRATQHTPLTMDVFGMGSAGDVAPVAALGGTPALLLPMTWPLTNVGSRM